MSYIAILMSFQTIYSINYAWYSKTTTVEQHNKRKMNAIFFSFYIN
jgi:hypothetical protein